MNLQYLTRLGSWVQRVNIKTLRTPQSRAACGNPEVRASSVENYGGVRPKPFYHSVRFVSPRVHLINSRSPHVSLRLLPNQSLTGVLTIVLVSSSQVGTWVCRFRCKGSTLGNLERLEQYSRYVVRACCAAFAFVAMSRIKGAVLKPQSVYK